MSITYNHLTSGNASTGLAINTASITVPGNGLIVARILGSVDSGKLFTCAGSGLTFTTPSGADATVPAASSPVSFDEHVKCFIATAPGGGFNDVLTIDSDGPDHVAYCCWEVGYFAASDVNGTVLGYSGSSLAADNTLKSVALSTTPLSSSCLLSAWGTVVVGGAGAWTAKASPAWTQDASVNYFASGIGSNLGAHSFVGSDTPAQATPSDGGGGYQLQMGIAIEVQAAGGGNTAPDDGFSFIWQSRVVPASRMVFT